MRDKFGHPLTALEILNGDERRSAETIMEFQAAEIHASPLQVIFDVAAYLRDGNSVVEMFDMIQRLKAACE
jgi:hypothetical protein